MADGEYISQGGSASYFWVPIERVQGELEAPTPGPVTPSDPVPYSDYSRPQVLHRGSWSPGYEPRIRDDNFGAFAKVEPSLHVGVIWDPMRMGFVLPGLPHREGVPTPQRAALHERTIPSGRTSPVPGPQTGTELFETEPV